MHIRRAAVGAARTVRLRGADTKEEWSGVPVKFRTSGCLASIVLSVVLTVVLNLMLRGCSG